MALEYNSDMTAGLRMNLQEFLDWEFEQETKHEFVDGEVVAFAGATNRHNWIAAQLLAQMLPKARPCRTLGSSALIQMERSARYADVLVSCDERDASRSRTIRYPKLIVEVLSESTAAVDRSEKVDEYTAIGTLEEYVLIDSRKRWAQVIRRGAGGWTFSPPVVAGMLRLASIDFAIDLDAHYADVEFD